MTPLHQHIASLGKVLPMPLYHVSVPCQRVEGTDYNGLIHRAESIDAFTIVNIRDQKTLELLREEAELRILPDIENPTDMQFGQIRGNNSALTAVTQLLDTLIKEIK
jgi:hypothetical protein